MPSSKKSQDDKPPTFFEKPFWDRPAIDPRRTGSKDHAEVYTLVGAALSIWEGVEVDMAYLFQVLFQAKEADQANAAKRIFGVVESSATRRNMLIEVGRIYLGQWWSDARFRKPFQNLMNVHQWASHRRDEIAHGLVTTFHVQDNSSDSTNTMSDVGTFLVAADYNSARNLFFEPPIENDVLAFHRSRYRYTAEDIHRFALNFARISAEIRDFCVGLHRAGNGPPKYVLDILTAEHGAKGG